jgi:hypothetical protein
MSDLITVPLANFEFKFRRLVWKEEFEMKTKGLDEKCVYLATALVEVSGLKIKNFQDAYRLMTSLPTPILSRVLIVYKGMQPENQHFTTGNLYKAPDPIQFTRRREAIRDDAETTSDALVKRMESTFGKKELAEAAEIDRQIVRGSGHRGAIPKHADDEEDQNRFGGQFKKARNAK